MSSIGQSEDSRDVLAGSQAAMPRGPLRQLIGRVMAVANAGMERRAVDQLMLGSSARLLAVGFGPGIGVIHGANQVPHGLVAGVDPVVGDACASPAPRRTRWQDR